jgi:tRNA uridine 5-carbamoylmethylation protein Kti12
MVETTSQLSTSTWSDDSDSPEVIRARIQETRTHMSEVVEAIQLRLSPERLTQEAKEMMKDATVRKVEEMANMTMNKADSWRTQMMETIRQNPIPAALVGIGLSWLLIEGRRSPTHRQGDYSGRYYDPSREMRYYPEQKPLMAKAQDTIAENVSQVQDKASEMTQNVQDKLGQVAGTVQAKAGDVANRASETASNLQAKASETASNLQAKASEMTSNLQSTVSDQADYLSRQAQYQTDRAKQTFQNTLEQNPLAVGAVAIVAGAAIGLMLPITQKEDELMGEARDRLLHQAQDKAKETLKMVEDRAGEAYRTATEGTALQDNEPQQQEARISNSF